MDTLTLVIVILAVRVLLVLPIAYWASGGGTPRAVVGGLLSWVIGTIIGVPVYLVALAIYRRRRRTRAALTVAAVPAEAPAPPLTDATLRAEPHREAQEGESDK